ncbi:tellurite resistance TerB family protein [Mailhella sp.]|uniref:tellurite resistance TerB family protein n=1 Tax=Mailhella sp. TaxID=1981029 RepID=UPI003AB2BAE8
MSLFDVLNSPDLRSAAGSFAEKARKTASDVTSGAPGGLGGLLGAGALGALLGGFVSKSVLKDAALVGAGAVAWNFYQKWSRSRDAAAPLPEAEPASVPSRAPVQAAPARSAADEDPTAMLMLRSMVYAARADGHIDASERGRILDLVERLCPGRDVTATVNGLMNEPIDPARLAACVRAPEEGEDLYRLSCLIVDVDHFMERSYLDGLASALRIPRDRQLALEGEADQARRRLPG